MTNEEKINWTSLSLRIIIGWGFIVHGWAKISHGTGGFDRLLQQANVPLHHLMSLIAPYTELIGGILILSGFLVRWISIPLIITMLTAMFTINIHYGFSSIKTIGLTPEGPVFGPPGYEVNLLYIASLLSLVFIGGGYFSLDRLIYQKSLKK